jgi:lipoprotein-anchoring transpeptidase ErfK/SrfK
MKLPVLFTLIAIIAVLLGGAAPAAENRGGTFALAQQKQAQESAAGTETSLPIRAEPMNGSLPFMFGLFDAQKPVLEPLTEEQAAFDESWALRAKRQKVSIRQEFQPTKVAFRGYRPGSIVIDTAGKYLYFVESPVSAIRYGIAVGKEGLAFTGKTTVGNKQVWPRWTPTSEMIKREPQQYRRYADGMDGGLDNPLGARAIYLHQGRNDTYLRIHGTNQPRTIGTASSNGCFRMHNEHVIDLFQRVRLGAEVVIL